MAKREVNGEAEATRVGVKRVKMNAMKNKVDAATGLSQCFHVVRSKLYLSLAPCHIRAPVAGIKSQHLNQLVMRYNRDLDGVVVGYRSVELLTEEFDEDTVVATVSEENPFAFVWVNVEFLVWAPKVGDVLEGYCTMQSRGHIGLLIHDVFNATIRKRNIPGSWEFVPNQQDESEEGHSLGHWADDAGVPVDGKLQFTVRSIQAAGKSIALEGTLLGKGAEADELPLELGLDEPKEGNHTTFDDNVNITIDGVELQAGDDDDDDATGAVGYADDDADADDSAKDGSGSGSDSQSITGSANGDSDSE